MRPEEQRSLSEPQPEILGVRPQATSPMERAQALVTQWEVSLGLPYSTASDPLGRNTSVIMMTNDVRDRMRDDIVKLLNETISLEHKPAVRVHCWAQNLTDGERGSLWQAGRAWLTVWRGDPDTGVGYAEVLEVNPEWHVGWRNSFALALTLGGGDGNRDINLHVDVGLAQLFLTFGSPAFRPWMDRILPGYWIERGDRRYQHFDKPGPNRLKVTQEMEIKVNWHSGGLWWSLWHSTMEWKSTTPKWRNGHFDPIDWLLGREAYSTRDISTEPVEVPMPEKTYAGTVRLFESTWKRPRWPLSRHLVRADIEVEGGVPHPGKGENSWDCGEDATYSLTCQARTAEEAVGKLVGSVLRSRGQYGGRNWRPQESFAS